MPIEKDLEPGQRWEFDGDVAGAFDDMLERSIPQYRVMREAVARMAVHYARRSEGTSARIVDLGAARGAMIDDLLPLLPRRDFVAVEVSDPMLDALRGKFEQPGSRVEVRKLDLRGEYPTDQAAVTLAVLTLQFVPINYRHRILRSAWEHAVGGGCLILVEKVLGESAEVDDALVAAYHGLKGENGYGRDEIERKRLALEGVLVPLTASWNVDALHRAGFREVDCFWAWMNFRAWIAVR